MQHYAFLVDDESFVRCLAFVEERGITYWADPQLKREGETNTEHGGRGFYFFDPAGHAIEIITRPYGSKHSGVSRSKSGAESSSSVNGLSTFNSALRQAMINAVMRGL